MKAKTIIAVTLSVCLVCTGSGYGIYYYMQNNKSPVSVTPVSYLSTQYYGDSSSISGTASSDVNQQVQLDGTNTVKEVYVNAGDTVKVGDKLMAYDTTLTELDLEMEKLNQATLGLKMEAAQTTLDKLYNTTPVERDDTASVISNEKNVSMAATEGTTGQEQGEVETVPLNPETQAADQTEMPVTEPTEAQTETESPAQEQTETQAPEQTESDPVPLDPQTEAPVTNQTEPDTSPVTELPMSETEAPDEETEFVLPTESQSAAAAVDTLDYKSEADDGEGTKEKPFIFYCTENVTIKGSFLNLARGWNEEGTMQIAGGAYVVVAVRAQDAADGKQRVLRLDGTSDKRMQGYRPDSEWKFTTEGLEIIVDQEGNRVLDGQTPELIKTKDFEKEFADKKEEEQTESETSIQTETQEPVTEGETIPQETQTETGVTEPETVWDETETEPETVQTEPDPGEKLDNMIVNQETENLPEDSTEPESTVEPEETTEPESTVGTEETTESESTPGTEETTETETQAATETESETETEPGTATLPNAAPKIVSKLVYNSVDKHHYNSGSGTKEDPYIFICEENAKVTGGFLNRVMGFDKNGKNRDMEKSCYAQLEIRENKNGTYSGKTIIKVLLDGTTSAEVGFDSSDVWTFGRLGLVKQDDVPGEEIEELSELNYASLGDENYEGGAYYKGTGTKNDPYTFRCADEAIVQSSFINRVLGYDEAGEEKITDGCFVLLEIKDPESDDGFIEQLKIDGTQKHDPYPPTVSWIFTTGGLQLVEEEIPDETEWWGDDLFPDDNYFPDDQGITYTAEELKAAIREQEELIKSLTLDEKESELKITQYEKKVKDGVVLSSINGVVKTVGDAETGESDGDAFIVVTSDSGMYIVGNVSELNLGTLEVGDEVSVQSLESGMQYTAVITEISKYPADSNNNYYGYGTENTNASYYPFKAYVEEADGLTDMSSVTISVSANADGTDTIYLQMAYVRSENGQSYVYKAGEDGKLKKQYVRTGQIIYSSYMEIKEGLTMDDSIAFPYGSDVKDGAKTQVSDSGGYY